MGRIVGVLNNKEIEVTIASLVASRSTAKENYSVRVDRLDESVDNHAEQVVIYDYFFHNSIFLTGSGVDVRVHLFPRSSRMNAKSL